MNVDSADLECLAWSIALFVALLGLYTIGLRLQSALPARHYDDRSRASTQSVVALMISLIGIVLGMMVSTAKNSFDAVGQEVNRYAIEIQELDHLLSEYGPPAAATRDQL